MNIIYCHHAERDFTGKQNDNITEFGRKDADLVGKMFKQSNIKAIYTSPFFRCIETARIINKHLNVPIYEEPRFNEFKSMSIFVRGKTKDETWIDLQKRVIAAIEDIVSKHNNEDTVICVTSGVNIAGFIDWQLNLKPSKNMAYIGVKSCSPIIFRKDKKDD